MSRALYNEIDPFAAAWLRELIARNLIARGDVAECSIEDLTPNDLRGYTQFHGFAGIGVWSYALRRAGWPDDRPVWTMSCPCQPFSAAGKGAGFADERHLWPAAHYLVRECRPSKIFGEQVASKDGLGWLDLVQADLEGSGYACGAVDTCSAGSGAPHIRQRLRFVAERLEHTSRDGRQQGRPEPSWRGVTGGCGTIGLADDHDHGREAGLRRGSVRAECDAEHGSGLVWMADARLQGLEGRNPRPMGFEREAAERGSSSQFAGQPAAGPTNGFWRAADWLFCRDGKWRPVEPGTFPLAHGAAARVGRLRGYGNAVDAEATRHFIEAYLETKAIEADGHFRLTDLSGFTTDNEGIFS